MRREPDFFGDRQLALVYMARRLKEALALEKVLTAGELDYLVETAPFTSGFLFRSQRMGVFFYVELQFEDRARTLMKQSGFDRHQTRVRIRG